MAFPAIETTATSFEASTNSHDVTMPASIASGDLLILCFAVQSNEVITWPNGANDGFTEFFRVNNSGFHTLAFAYRDANGSEPSTVAVATDTIESSAHSCYRISGAESPGTQVPEASTGVSATTANPNPDSLAPTGGAKDYLWIAVAGNNKGETTDAIPGGYANKNSIESGSGATHTGIGTADRTNNDTSEDPGTFTTSASQRTVAATIAIHPPGAGGPDPITEGDTGTGTTAYTAPKTTSPIESDTGTGTTDYSVAGSTYNRSASDTGTGTTAYTAPKTTAVSGADTGTGTTDFTTDVFKSAVGADTGTGTTAASLAGSTFHPAESDTGTGTTAYTAPKTTSVVGADTGTGTTAYTAPKTAAASVSDTGTGTTAYTAPKATIVAVTDTATGTTAYVTLKTATVTEGDTATGTTTGAATVEGGGPASPRQVALTSAAYTAGALTNTADTAVALINTADTGATL